MDYLPDVYAEPAADGHAVVANKKGRRVLNKGFDSRPPWARRVNSGGLASPEYRAVEIEDVSGACVAAMLCSAYAAGLRVMTWCDDCRGPHLVDDLKAKDLWAIARGGSAAAMPAHETLH